MCVHVKKGWRSWLSHHLHSLTNITLALLGLHFSQTVQEGRMDLQWVLCQSSAGTRVLPQCYRCCHTAWAEGGTLIGSQKHQTKSRFHYSFCSSVTFPSTHTSANKEKSNFGPSTLKSSVLQQIFLLAHNTAEWVIQGRLWIWKIRYFF